MSKTVAAILAGGSGTRMGQPIPKQFLSINDKPVIIYALESFQTHPEVDEIVVACSEGWDMVLRAFARQFGVTKLVDVVPGGDSGLSSTGNVVRAIEGGHGPDDVVLVHDAVRPMVPRKVISDCVRVARRHGAALPVLPSIDSMYVTVDGEVTREEYPRDSLKRGYSPLGFRLGLLAECLREGRERGLEGLGSIGPLMTALGREMHLFPGSSLSFKLTTVEDVELFKAMLETERPVWLR